MDITPEELRPGVCDTCGRDLASRLKPLGFDMVFDTEEGRERVGAYFCGLECAKEFSPALNPQERFRDYIARYIVHLETSKVLG